VVTIFDRKTRHLHLEATASAAPTLSPITGVHRTHMSAFPRNAIGPYVKQSMPHGPTADARAYSDSANHGPPSPRTVTGLSKRHELHIVSYQHRQLELVSKPATQRNFFSVQIGHGRTHITEW
jgi:hypothetical protein